MFPLVVAGCTSDAVKALLVPTLRVWIRRKGVGVASFKTQSMSNNDSVVATDHGSGEISVAQWLQALAAGIEPDIRMNPLFLRPEADLQSRVMARG